MPATKYKTRISLIRYDCVGEDPYTILEVVPDKLWKVKYDVGMTLFAGEEQKQQAKAFGMDPNDPAYAAKVLAGAEQYGEKAVEVARQDIQKCVEAWAKDSYTDEEIFMLSAWSLNSFVIKLKSGSLLLYAPVKVREETGFAQWVDSLGRCLAELK